MKHFRNIPSYKMPFVLNSRFNNFICHYLALKKAVFVTPAIFILIISFNGCLVLPVPYRSDDPFPDEKMSFLIPGTTTKTTVKEKLGNPWAHRFGEKIYVYAGGQRDWMWLWGVWAGYTGGVGAVPTYSTHLLIIEFDKKDVVSAAQEFSGDSGDIKSGLYIINSGGYTHAIDLQNRVWSFSDERLILGASKFMEKQARQYHCPINKSVIFYYKNFSHILELKLDSILSVDPGSDGFLVWIVDPGSHTISTAHDHHPEKLIIRCNPGESYYVEHREGMIIEVNKSNAEKEIAKRRLIIDRLVNFDVE